MSAPTTDFTLLQVIPELETGGAEQSTLDIARAVVAAGGRALVATRGGRMIERLKTVGGEWIEIPAQSKNPATLVANAARLIGVIRREKVSVIHARSRAPAFSALWAAQATGIPFVATYHGVYRASSGLKRWYNAVMTRGELVIANSEFTRKHVLAEHDIDPERIVTIPRGVDLERFDPDRVSAERVETLRTAWNLPPAGRKVVFLLAGRLTPIKGHLVIIEAVRRLPAEVRDGLLVVFAGDDQGRTGYLEILRSAIAAAGLDETIRIVGHCDDMPAAYLLADVALLPTLVPESFGRAAVEPQVMERPVIVSDHGAVRETVVGFETGWLTTVDDPDDWAEALTIAVDAGPERRAAMGRDAARRARRLYSVDAMCEATLKVYARLLEGRR